MFLATPEISEENRYFSTVKAKMRDEFLAAMFLAPELRGKLLLLYALIIELEQVHGAVTEEIYGHMRYAWWYENIEAAVTKNHPLIALLAEKNISPDLPLEIVSLYKDSFPEMPGGGKITGVITKFLESEIFVIARRLEPTKQSMPENRLPRIFVKNARNDISGGLQKMHKAEKVIAAHRLKFGQKYDAILLIRLLLV